MKFISHLPGGALLVAASLGISASLAPAQTMQPAQVAPAASAPAAGASSGGYGGMCPLMGWSEGLGAYLDPAAQMPTSDTKNIPTQDCAFHQWSWEAFIWATAIDKNGVPRFMTFPTLEDLLGNGDGGGRKMLRLSARSGLAHVTEGAGAIVEADGNMLVAQNGYPVYASVHMNPSYFATAKRNMIKTGGYNSRPADENFSVGAAVIKATWLRLDRGERAPAGAFTTQAEVPRLIKVGNNVIPSGAYDVVTVALVGMHVAGYTDNHPEFLWSTFEHRTNAPMAPDNEFSTSGKPVPRSFTFYKGNTPFTKVNLPNSNPPTLTFNPRTGKFSPVTNVVQENRTGGEDQPGGPGNIDALNRSAHSFLNSRDKPEDMFATYDLIGTVWMKPNSYNLNSDQSSAVGSVNLANSTAETFVQQATNKVPPQQWQNCFMCHNAQSYTFQQPALKPRLIAQSHALAEGTAYAVPNVMPVKK